ncbi:MAG: hypothetical protein E4H36_00790 [Spirochaetales bacterium]|nr:MAG: hypothetical protein E4H36_00790 [Spirochaetales bacterium]
MRQRSLVPADADYLRILENKTALLMAMSCQAGAMLNGASKEIAEACRNFGLCFGMAYQLVDDFNDQDAAVSRSLDMLGMAENFIEEAKKSLAFAEGKDSHQKLVSLCGYTLNRRE